MSSHHFVKDGQEADLLVLDWTEKLEEQMLELLGWQPFFVLNAALVDKMDSIGIKPDALINVNTENIPTHWLPIKTYNRSEYLNKVKSLNIIIKHFDSDSIKLFETIPQLCIYGEDFKIYQYNQKYLKKEVTIQIWNNKILDFEAIDHENTLNIGSIIKEYI